MTCVDTSHALIREIISALVRRPLTASKQIPRPKTFTNRCNAERKGPGSAMLRAIKKLIE
jgi:hypothetical protein